MLEGLTQTLNEPVI